MCIKKFRILIFVLSPVYMIWKNSSRLLLNKNLFFTDRPPVDIEIYLQDI